MSILKVSLSGIKKSFILTGFLFCVNYLHAQQTNITDYVIFGGKNATGQTAPAAPGYGVQIGASCNLQATIQGGGMGSIGSYKLVKSTGSVTVNGNIYSGGTIQLSNSNVVKGNLAAGLSPAGVPGTIVSIGTSATIGISGDPSKGNINANGKVTVGGGIIYGRVTLPSPQSLYPYTGPAPAGGVVYGTPTLPTLPQMPGITTFPNYGSTNITTTMTIAPGAYGDINLGNNTLTLSGPGKYTFKSIKTTGPNCSIVYDFKNTTTGNFLIYVHGDIVLNKTSFSMSNKGSATAASCAARIYVETHGTGSTNTNDNTAAFYMSNGSNGTGNPSGWLGSLWAPYAAIMVGTPNGPSSTVLGALWSGTQVNIQGGVTVTYAPFSLCNPPDANAGSDKPLDFVNQTTLTGTSATPNVTFSWSVLAGSGGVITSTPTPNSITVSAAGSYILTVTSTQGCFTKDTVVVTGKVNDIIGSELLAVVENYNAGGPPSPFFNIQSDKIFIDVIVKQGEYANVKAILSNAPWNMTNFLGEDASNFIITGLFSISKLLALNSDPVLLPKIVYVRPYYRAYNNFALDPTGLVSTQGDTAIRSNLVRQGYDLSGDGIRIGVISNSFNTITAASTNPVSNTYAQDVANKDLPGPGNPNNQTPVTVLKESSFQNTDEGRAMLQIIHDIAPRAQLYFRTGVETANDFAQGIRDLKAAGCNIITDDITYITEPFLKDGVVASAVKEVTAAGTTYISAAGNFANNSVELPFNPMPAPGGLSGKANNFSGGDAFLNVNLFPGDYTIVLQWVDDIYSQGETANNGTKNDLDIYLTPNTDGTALFGFNRNNLNGDPIEFLPFGLSGTPNIPIPTNILIINNTATSNPARFKIVIFKGKISFNEYINGGSTIIGQSNSDSAITVGAARFDRKSTLETFSSVGGTFIAGFPRNKPDLVAPDGVNVTVNMGIDQSNDPDPNYSNFFGTSAAAPHVAGVAALIMEGKKKFLNQSSVTPYELKSLLKSTAIPMGPTTPYNLFSGAGFINADAAMRTFAAPDPTLIQLIVPQDVTPGPAPFTLSVTGVNLSPTSVVNLGPTTLTTNFVNTGNLTATVPAFIGDPAITVFTPPLVTNGIDGGTSEALRFTDVPKRKIVVKADNKTKKYAQNLPAFSSTITVDGKSMAELMAESGQTLQQVLQAFGLENLTYTLPAGTNAMSNVGTYSITPGRTFNPQDPADTRLLEIYEYTFIAGDLTNEKLPVTLTANSFTTPVYFGEKLPDIQYSYAFTNASDAATISDPTAFLNAIRAAHQNNLAKDAMGKDILGVVNGKAVTIENGKAVTIENGKAVTIENGKAVTIENGIQVPVVNAQGLTIQNGVVTDTSGVALTPADINNLSFLATDNSLVSARVLANKKLINGNYVTESTRVIDVTQESILDFNANAAQTSLLNAVSDVREKGLIDKQSYENGKAVTIENGKAVTIENGLTITRDDATIDSIIQIESGFKYPPIINGQPVIVNGKAVTIENGKAVTIENGESTPLVSSQNRTAVIVDYADIGQVHETDLKSVNMITGLDVGNQFIIPGALVNDNLLITNVAGTATILPAQVIISPVANQSKIFGAQDPVFTYTNNAGLAAGDFTGALGRVSGNNVGTYMYTLGTLSAGPNYTLVLATGASIPKFAITPKPVSITPDPGQSKIYGDADPVFTFTNNAGLTAGAFTGALGRATGNSVNTYAYTIGTLSAGNNYTLTIGGTNTFAITKAPLQVKADLKWITKGSPLPAFTSVITGLKYSDNPTVSYSLSPSCTGAAGVYTIIPLLNPFANSGSYTVTYINSQLYINPKGSGVDDVDTYLECVEDRGSSYTPANRRYVARFYAKNTNSTPVYVPIGSDNKLSSSGSFDGAEQPVIFLPGNGTTRFNVPFDGVQLTWALKTYEGNSLVTESVYAKSTSNKCSNQNRGSVPDTLYTGPEEILNGNEEIKTVLKEKIKSLSENKIIVLQNKTTVDPKLVPEITEEFRSSVYPNPAENRIIISIQSGILNEKGLLLFDVNGRVCPVKVTRRVAQHSLELDISQLRNGFYFIKVKSADGYRTLRFVKG